jgi:hypothetical protein
MKTFSDKGKLRKKTKRKYEKESYSIGKEKKTERAEV